MEPSMVDDKSNDIKARIKTSGMTIFDILPADSDCYYSTSELVTHISTALIGQSFSGLPIRTRSKSVKSLVCKALGYPVPKSFRKTQPRFLGQNFDIYVQKSNNLQIWNEDISSDRRYIIIALDSANTISKITALTGNQLKKFDMTGTMTRKYQAKFTGAQQTESELFDTKDTATLSSQISDKNPKAFTHSPSKPAAPSDLLSISEIYKRLLSLVEIEFINPGVDQERKRGEELQKLVCTALGYKEYGDTGQFPDIFNQLLEIKLQTSPTIDLGNILPTSEEALNTGEGGIKYLHYKDARYAVFYGKVTEDKIILTKLVVLTGESFFKRFQKFEGKVVNKKVQLKLPDSFF